MKSVARLTGSLLARKGFAAPAQNIIPDSMMHSQHHVMAHPAVTPQDKPGLVATRLAAIREQATGSSKPTSCTKGGAEGCRVADNDSAGDGKRVAMTLRLDSRRHLKLRVLAAHVHMSSQEILTVALDEYLERNADKPGLRNCDCLHES